MEIRLEPSDGRFEAALRAAQLPPCRIEIELFDQEGQPWMVHPSWGNDPATPAVLTAEMVLPGIVDRAVDLRLLVFWRAEHPEPDPKRRIRDYSDWARKQRDCLGHALVRDLR